MVAGATFAVCMITLELVFRVAFGPVVEKNVTPMPNAILSRPEFPGLRHVFRPGVSFTDEFESDPRGYLDPGATLTYHVNSLGFRGPETTVEKPAGRFRIAALGDSVLFGSGVRDEDTLTRVLEQELTRAGYPCEVLNFGVPAYDTCEESVFLRRIALDYRPDLVFFLFFLNDAGGGSVFGAFNAIGEKSGLRRASVLYDHLAARAARGAAITQLVEDYHSSFGDNVRGWLLAQEALKKAKAAADRRNVPVVLVIFPLLYRLDASYPFASIHEKVARRGRELGYRVLDLLPAFQGRVAESLWAHPRDQHPNEIGHALAARAIMRFLIDERLMPSPAH